MQPYQRSINQTLLLTVCLLFILPSAVSAQATDKNLQWQALNGLEYLAFRPVNLESVQNDVFPPENLLWPNLRKKGLGIGTKDGGTSGTMGYLAMRDEVLPAGRHLVLEVIREVELPGDPGHQWPAIVWSSDVPLDADSKQNEIIKAATTLVDLFAKNWVHANPCSPINLENVRFTGEGVLDVSYLSWSATSLFLQPKALVLRGYVTAIEMMIESDDEVMASEVPGTLEVQEVVFAHPALGHLVQEIKTMTAGCFHHAEVGDHVLVMIGFYEGGLGILNYESNSSLGIRLPRPAEAVDWDVATLLGAIRTGHAWQMELANERELETLELLDPFSVERHRWMMSHAESGN